METVTYPELGSSAHFALFTSLKNPGALRERIIKAATLEGKDGDKERAAVNFGFIDARLITSRLHLQTAIYQALLAEAQKTLRTKTVHSEILWVLNPTNNITEALRRFGVSESTQSLVVVHVCQTGVSGESVSQQMSEIVAGDLQPMDALAKVTDWPAVKKVRFPLDSRFILLERLNNLV
ncbi:hypothetical protein HGRIS_009880 [Hohenbuehelia grisea]|uniref:EKC/KEOPS complex subunit CGI121 n=1 Tax=Hohenbuehelia grisea TaxID=104357 RepID=A0ABR3J2W0_9AGAR